MKQKPNKVKTPSKVNQTPEEDLKMDEVGQHVEESDKETQMDSNHGLEESNDNVQKEENAAQSGGDDDDDDEMDIKSLTKPKKKRKKGIIYISNIPKHMNVTRLREILGQYGKIGRVYLQPEKVPGAAKRKRNKNKHYALHFTEGWVEFESKRVAKQIVPLLNNKQISTRKKSHFYDSLWSMKYLPRFKWVHLTERMNYEEAVHKQRLRTEVSQARKETTFFQNNLDKSEYLKKQTKKTKKKEVPA